MNRLREDRGSVMLEYIVVCFGILCTFFGTMSVCGLFNPFDPSGGYLNKAFVEHYQIVAKAISLPYP